eukprot:s3140_g3.t2
MFCCRRRSPVDLTQRLAPARSAEEQAAAPATGAARSTEGRICPITGLEGICPMARKPVLGEGEKPPELKVLMFIMWEEAESKVSVGVYPHHSSDWEALELPDTASKAEIKAQYRKLSIRYHPDKCKEEGAQKRFARIAEAYDALKDTDGQLAFAWEEHPEGQQLMAGSDLIKTLGFLGAEAAQTDPIKAQFMQQVVKEATECRVLLFEKETQEAERHMQETWADALCVDERSGANHLVKVYRRIVTFAESALSAAKADMEEVDD